MIELKSRARDRAHARRPVDILADVMDGCAAG